MVGSCGCILMSYRLNLVEGGATYPRNQLREYVQYDEIVKFEN